jgi:transcriptional regulator of met regulon
VRDNGVGFSLKESNKGTKTGLYIIRQTIFLMNQSNKNKMIFQIHNIKSDTNVILGCEAFLHIPVDMFFYD